MPLVHREIAGTQALPDAHFGRHSRATVTAQTAYGINERIERYRLSEKCAEYTDEGIAFLAVVLRNEPREVIKNCKKFLVWDYSTEDRFKAFDRLFDRAYGRPATPMQIDERQQQLKDRKSGTSGDQPEWSCRSIVGQGTNQRRMPRGAGSSHRADLAFRLRRNWI
jgi:hypothetical protein